MVIWGAICGLLLGFFGYNNLFFGALLGAGMGWALDYLVKQRVREEWQVLQKSSRVEDPQDIQDIFSSTDSLQNRQGNRNVSVPEQGSQPAIEPNVVQSAANLNSSDKAYSNHPQVARTPTAQEINQVFGLDAHGTKPSTQAQNSPPPLPQEIEPLWSDSELKTKQPKTTHDNVFEKGIEAARAWFLGGNTIVRLGLTILFIGLSFLARFAAQAGLLPVELRLAGIGLGGIALLAVGYRQRIAKPGFGLALQGGGVAVMYLTLFTAFRMYGLLPQTVAFLLMVLVCAAGCTLALLQNARSLAFLAFAGGFATPILLSTGGGSHVVLFSYYTLLNLAIVFLAWRRAWRELNLLGFVATFGIATMWGVLRFSSQYYMSAQIFLLGFVAIFTAVAIGYARQTRGRFGHVVDNTLIFGTALAGFGLQIELVRHFENGSAFSALFFGAFYLLLAFALRIHSAREYSVLQESFIALGVGFVTLAVPLGFEARLTGAIWALEGAAAFWVGMRQARWMPRAMGLALQGLAALVFLTTVQTVAVSAVPLAHAAFLGALLIALPALTCACWLRKPLLHSGSSWAKWWESIEVSLKTPVFLYGFGFWCFAWLLEWTRRVPAAVAGQLPQAVFSQTTVLWLFMLTFLGSSAVALWVAQRRHWRVAAIPSRLSLVLMVASLFIQWALGDSALGAWGWLVWPLALLTNLWIMRVQEQIGAGDTAAWVQERVWQHACTIWLIVALLADALWWLIKQGGLQNTAWANVIILAAVTAVLAVLTVWAGRANQLAARSNFRWPLNPHAQSYYVYAAIPLALMAFIGALLLACTSAGDTAPLPYIPLLNPTDLVVLLSLGSVLLWRRMLLAATPQPKEAKWVNKSHTWLAIGVVGLVVLSTIWLRIAHHFFNVVWSVEALFASFVVQTGYAILWTLLALVLMVVAHRRVLRSMWLAGVVLLALVVVKLALVDLSNSGGVERIVAFIGVGILMLVVGYFAPIPPKTMKMNAAKKEG